MSLNPIVVRDRVIEEYRDHLQSEFCAYAAIDAVLTPANGLTRDQYAHGLSTFSRTSYKEAPRECLAAFDELQSLGLEAFAEKHDPYWDIPLNEDLPQPTVEMPGFAGPNDRSPLTINCSPQQDLFECETTTAPPVSEEP